MPLPSEQCSSECAGGGSQCGGAWALSLYNLSPRTYVGCTRDSPTRLLSFESSDNAMTVSSCLAACQGKGYTFGGVEYGRDCFCGNSVNGGSKIDESFAGMSCAGGGTGCG